MMMSFSAGWRWRRSAVFRRHAACRRRVRGEAEAGVEAQSPLAIAAGRWSGRDEGVDAETRLRSDEERGLDDAQVIVRVRGLLGVEHGANRRRACPQLSRRAAFTRTVKWWAVSSNKGAPKSSAASGPWAPTTSHRPPSVRRRRRAARSGLMLSSETA